MITDIEKLRNVDSAVVEEYMTLYGECFIRIEKDQARVYSPIEIMNYEGDELNYEGDELVNTGQNQDSII